MELTTEEWANQLLYVKSITKSTKLQYFQYRLRHRKIVTNSLRYRWDSTISPLCTFCGLQGESQFHIFWECVKLTKFWQSMQRWFKYMFQLNLVLTPPMIIYNNYIGMHKDLINTVILIAKQYIYSCKCQQKSINFVIMLQKVFEHMEIERAIAMSNSTFSKFYRKWAILIQM